MYHKFPCFSVISHWGKVLFAPKRTKDRVEKFIQDKSFGGLLQTKILKYPLIGGWALASQKAGDKWLTPCSLCLAPTLLFPVGSHSFTVFRSRGCARVWLFCHKRSFDRSLSRAGRSTTKIIYSTFGVKSTIKSAYN